MEEIIIEQLNTEYVDIEEFSKNDLRVVKIMDCKAVEKSNKLLEFKIDDGIGERTILSGIHAYYKPEDLIGKKVIAILNLPPRKMMGIDSEGMLLSSVYEYNGERKLNLMIVDENIPAGSKLY